MTSAPHRSRKGSVSVSQLVELVGKERKEKDPLLFSNCLGFRVCRKDLKIMAESRMIQIHIPRAPTISSEGG